MSSSNRPKEYPVNNQRGNFLIILGVLVLLIIVGSGTYYLGTLKTNSVEKVTESTNTQINNQDKATSLPAASSTSNSDLQTFTSSRCNFSIGYPKDWKIKDTLLVEGNNNPNYLYGCVDLEAPDFSTGLDSYSGFYVFISRTNLGATFNNIKINNLEDYIKAHESIIQPAMTVKGKISTSYGERQGTQFDKFGQAEQTAFIFINNNQIFEISWPKNYQGNYRNELSKIISSIQFPY